MLFLQLLVDFVVFDHFISAFVMLAYRQFGKFVKSINELNGHSNQLMQS